MRLKLIVSLIFILSCSSAQAQTVRVSSPSQHPYRHMPNELNTIDTAADEECYTYESDTAQGEWQTCGAGGGSGDPILIDGTAVTDASGVDLIGGTTGIDITFSAAASPDTATFGLDLTEITCGAGLACSAATTIATASSEADFLASGALVCGAGTAGKMQVHTTPLQYCDNAATPALQYAAYGDSSGNATGVACTGCVTTADAASLDISDDTNLAVTAPVTLTGDTVGLNQNAGTDVTADLEEETHASEHIVGGADTVFASDPNANNAWTWDDTAGAGEWGTMSDFSYSGTAWTIAADKVLESHLKAVDAAADEECLTYEVTTGDFEWQSCGAGGGGDNVSVDGVAVTDPNFASTGDIDFVDTSNTVTANINANAIVDGDLAITESINLPIYSAKLTGSFVVRTPTSGDASTQGAQIDAGDGNWRLLFDATTDEAAVWQFRLPDYWAAHSELNVFYTMTSGTANEVEFEVDIMCISDGDAADIGTASFAGVAVGSATVPGTVGYPDEISITLTDDSCAAGDIMFLYLSTDADDATNDDATGDREVVGVEYEFTR